LKATAAMRLVKFIVQLFIWCSHCQGP